MSGDQRLEIIQELECVHNAILQSEDTDDSSSSAIRNFAIRHPDDSIVSVTVAIEVALKRLEKQTYVLGII